jgi:cytochrome c oxidase subunit 4
MSTEAKAKPLEAHHQTHEHEHPSDMLYVKVFAVLFVLTAIEVSSYFVFSDPYTPVNVIGLLTLMCVKFFVVCSYFMHLKFDNPMFRRVFVAGLLLAVVVYVGIMMSTFDFWSSDFLKYLH